MPEMRDKRYGRKGDDLPVDEGLANGPIDFSAVQADDALLEALRSGDTGTGSSLTDGQVTDLLVAWRRDIDAEPMPELVDVDTALQTVGRARRLARRGPHRIGVPLASAASVLVVAFAGLGVAAHSAQPGDSLWGLTRVLYADHARSVEAAAAVRTELAKADAALREGRWDEAEASLSRARVQLAVIEPDEGREDLMHRHAELMDQLRSAPVPPPAPAAPPPAAASPTEVETTHEAPADPTKANSATETPPPKPTPTSTPPPPSSSPSSPPTAPASGAPASSAPATGAPASGAPASGEGVPGDTNSLPRAGQGVEAPAQPTGSFSSDGSSSAAQPEVYFAEVELT